MRTTFPLRIAALLLLAFALLGAGAGTGATTTAASPGDTLRIGDTAPDFTLPYATKDSVSREPVKLSSMLGKGPVVLAFYPADWSGGCTKEVCAFRDEFASLSAVNAQVLGLSGDYVYSHHEWAKHHNLPFALASDHDHAVGKLYSSYNEKYGVNNRTVYVVDKAGKVAYIDLRYSTRDDKSLKSLQAALAKMN